jgi:membrane protease YdiL (CAAX protease family)
MRAKIDKQVTPIGFGTSAVLFGGGAALLALATQVVIPRLIILTTAEPIIAWFVAASLCLFVPLLLAGVWLLASEYRYGRPWSERLRLRPMDKRGWRLALGGLVVIALLSGGCVVFLYSLGEEQGLHPAFMAMQPLTPERAWILGAWLPFFLLNILGEELVWRGVVLPRQELVFGRWAWLVNGTGWWLMHLAFPWQVLLTLLPTVFVVPYVAQRSQNTWVGIIVHAGLNGSGFLMLAFGLA